MLASPTRRSWTGGYRYSAATISFVCLILVGGLSGCANQHDRFTASDAYDKLALECLNDDIGYVRDHVSATYFGGAEGKPVTDPMLHKLMAELRTSRALSWKKTSTPDAVVVQVARVADGRVVHSQIHMTYSDEQGWRLVGAPEEGVPNTGQKK